MKSHWRTTAAGIISDVLDQCGTFSVEKPEDMKAVRARLREAYPFGERRYHPYKIWCDEVRRQLGLKWPIGHKKAWRNNQERWKTERKKLEEWEQLYGKRA